MEEKRRCLKTEIGKMNVSKARRDSGRRREGGRKGKMKGGQSKEIRERSETRDGWREGR